MKETSRIEALEAALAGMEERQHRNERALRGWRLGATLAAVLGCIVLPQFTRESNSAGNLNASVEAGKTNKRLKALELALFGVSPVPGGTVDRITPLSTALTAEVKARTAAVGAEATARTAAVNAEAAARIAADDALASSLTGEQTARMGADGAIHQVIDPFFALVSVQSVNNGLTGIADATEIVMEGANLHVRSGSGFTFAPENALGNVIIGYNELRGNSTDIRSGSHNLVVGYNQSYSRHAGVIGGFANTVNGPNCAAFGHHNTVGAGNGAGQAFVAGAGNTASGPFSSVLGGTSNIAAGPGAAILGGIGNTVAAANGHFP